MHAHIFNEKETKSSLVNAVTWTGRGCQHHQTCLGPPHWPYETWHTMNKRMCPDGQKKKEEREIEKGEWEVLELEQDKTPCYWLSSEQMCVSVHVDVFSLWSIFVLAYSPGSKILAGGHTVAPPPHTHRHNTQAYHREQNTPLINKLWHCRVISQKNLL